MDLRKGTLLKERLEMERVITADGTERLTIKPIEKELSFDKGFFVFIRALQLLTKGNDGTIIIGLAGPSGSGKTAFSAKVQSLMPDVCIISMDNYNDGSKVVDSNFDDPRVTDYDLLLQNIKDLKNGINVQMPIYDFKTSRRMGFRELTVPASRVVIIEGIYALSEKLRDLLDLKVSITGGIHFDLVKRVLRDLNRSGKQADEIIQQISDTVYPMYKAFIEPDLKTAQLKVYNTFNPFSGFICNPIYILKSKVKLSSESILEVLDESHLEVTETELVDIYLLPPNEDPEQCCSWLRMRSREGRYNLMFEDARILGGLMALGYEIGPILKRTSVVHSDGTLTIKQDTIEKLGEFIQIHGVERQKVREAGIKLGLEGTYIPRSYIEQVQLENLVAELKNEDVTEHLGLNRELLSINKDRSCGRPIRRLAALNSINNRMGNHRIQRVESMPLSTTHGVCCESVGDVYTREMGEDSPITPRSNEKKEQEIASAIKVDSDRLDQTLIELAKAVKTLTQACIEERARTSLLALFSASCILFGAGFIFGYQYGRN